MGTAPAILVLAGLIPTLILQTILQSIPFHVKYDLIRCQISVFLKNFENFPDWPLALFPVQIWYCRVCWPQCH